MIYFPLLPHPSFRQSVSCYSDSVLRKTLQLILRNRNVVCGNKSVEWANREMLLFWASHYQAYIRLGMMCMEEMDLRALPYLREKADRFSREKSGKHWNKPLWSGWERLHSNHRAILLQNGEVECIRHRVVKLLGLENVSLKGKDEGVTYWLRENGFTDLWDGDARCNAEVHNYLNNVRGASHADLPLNHYTQFNWTEEACGSIYVFPRDTSQPGPLPSRMAT